MKKIEITTLPGSRLLFLKDLEKDKKYKYTESASYLWETLLLGVTPTFERLVDGAYPAFTMLVEEDFLERLTYLAD